MEKEERRGSSPEMSGWQTNEILGETSRVGSWGDTLGPRNYSLIINWSKQSIVTLIVICSQIAHLVSLRKSWSQDIRLLILKVMDSDYSLSYHLSQYQPRHSWSLDSKTGYKGPSKLVWRVPLLAWLHGPMAPFVWFLGTLIIS